jgi:hypothetical protein
VILQQHKNSNRAACTIHPTTLSSWSSVALRYDVAFKPEHKSVLSQYQHRRVHLTHYFWVHVWGNAAEFCETVASLDEDLQAAKTRIAELEQQLAAATGSHGC